MVVRRLLALSLVAAAACQADGRLDPIRTPANFDANESAPKVSLPGAPGDAIDARTALPTITWAAPEDAALADGLDTETAAWTYLGAYADRYRVSPAVLATAAVREVHDTGDGAIIVAFKQRIAGIDVFRHELKVAMNRAHALVAISGHLSPQLPLGGRATFRLGAEDALAFAFLDLTGDDAAFSATGETKGDGATYALDAAAPNVHLVRPARAKRVWFALPDGVEAAWYVELNVGLEERLDSDYYSYVVSAADGRLLFRNNLTSHAFSYRVWADQNGIPDDGPMGKVTPHPTGMPDGYQAPFIAPVLRSIDHGPISTNDPWLPAGATTTAGNNVSAYADLKSPDGLGAGDLVPTTTAPGVFDRTYDTTKAPNLNEAQIMAATTSLFYVTNYLHDVYYDLGFNEAAGNAQHDNFGRGGTGGDRMLAEAQDYSGKNNANMQTPGDGESPIMQMYVFSPISGGTVQVTAPAGIAGTKTAAAAGFGPSSFSVTAEVVRVNDGTGVLSDACQTPFANAAALSGKIALLDRGTCRFVDKVNNAQAAGAIGVIVVNNVPGDPVEMPRSNNPLEVSVSCPSLMISQADGATIAGALIAGQTVTAKLDRGAVPERDGTIDNLIVAHEWTHYLSGRLVGNGNGLNSFFSGALGEGWSDFGALLMTAREADKTKPNNANYSGVYALAQYTSSGGANQGMYFGIRRVPYSTNMAKNPLTFKHIQADVALPPAPYAYGDDGGDNNEAHAAGEVWANMLWECYVGLLNDPRHSFTEAQKRMRSYLVASLKLTPMSPTLLEARDAVLAAAAAKDATDFATFAKAFAKRGAGLRATGPDRFSRDNKPVVESFAFGNDVAMASAALFEASPKCAPDEVLDNDDTAEIEVTVKNTGIGQLKATKATVTTTTPGVTLDNGGVITFAPMQPFATQKGIIGVSLSGAKDITAIAFSIAVSDPSLAVAGTVDGTLQVRANYNVAPKTSADDDVEADVSAWTATHDPKLGNFDFARVQKDAENHHWFGVNATEPADMYLTSPVLEVADTGDLTITFKHSHRFEARHQRYYDGGVIELSSDGGKTWEDIGAHATPRYTGTIEAQMSANPLKGKKAYGGTSEGYPEMKDVTLELGDAYQGQTVQIRFRIGTDDAAGSVGWNIDDLKFSGIKNKPFSTIVVDDGSCKVPGAAEEEEVAGKTPATPNTPAAPAAAGPIAETTGCGCRQGANPGDAIVLALAALVIAGRRRRRS
ncbi:MAG: M36 family metallopeptidase [Deltaproteobacteria bacterium]|nr:M36 family metallopeptidase [Deltaproteobacteria bacterium]